MEHLLMHEKALLFAIEAHTGQGRMDSPFIPYVYHPIDVAKEVVYYSGLPEEVMVYSIQIALLHDVVEDTPVRIEEVAEHFGEAVAVGVAALTKDDGVVNESAISRAAQLSESLVRLKTAPQYAQVVKLADRICNLETFPPKWSREKCAQYLREAELIVEAVGDSSVVLNARLLERIASRRRLLGLDTQKGE